MPTPVPLDLGHVVQTAHAESVVLAVKGASDGATYAGLADARRAHLKRGAAVRDGGQLRVRRAVEGQETAVQVRWQKGILDA